MKKALIWTIGLMLFSQVQAQTYLLDTMFSIQTHSDSTYGTATDYVGYPVQLRMDISVPVGDAPPSCGRPLMVLVHGGAFMVGSKADANIVRMREDFAKRGYVTAAVNYRLGMLGPPGYVNCNISPLLNAPWNCLNAQDSSEWYRAWHRSVQDVHGAIRYLVNHASTYNIDPQRIFVVGESAGGFIALGVGYLEESEVVSSLIGPLPPAAKPNSLYTSCHVHPIDSFDLARPGLGPAAGTLNQPALEPYRIAGIGNFFGGALYNYFGSPQPDLPRLYMFHQKDDMIVPFNRNLIFAKYAACATTWPWNCGWIQGRPLTYGSDGISKLIDTLAAQGQNAPVYSFDKVLISADCNAQLGGAQQHAIDNYWLRTQNMANFFLEPCLVGREETPEPKRTYSLYPNPVSPEEALRIRGAWGPGDEIQLLDLYGRVILTEKVAGSREEFILDLPTPFLEVGIYLIRIKSQGGISAHPVIIGK